MLEMVGGRADHGLKIFWWERRLIFGDAFWLDDEDDAGLDNSQKEMKKSEKAGILFV